MAAQGDTDPGYRALIRRLRKLQQSSVDVGMFTPEIATYAAASEFGTETIQSRPFFSTAIDENEERYYRVAQEAATRAMAGQASPLAPAKRIGIEARNDVIKSIQSGDWAPNAPSTIAGKGSSKPLVDTAAMQRDLTFRVNSGGGGE